MDITVYLPDAIGTEAKEAGLNFSGLLRTAVQQELAQRQAFESMADDEKEFVLDLLDHDGEGRPYKGRLTGTLVVEGSDGSQLFMTSDGRSIVYDPSELRYFDFTDADEETFMQEVRALCDSESQLIEVAGSLGRDVIIDL